MVDVELVPNAGNGAEDAGLSLEWIGQAGFILKLGDRPSICMDPYYSNSIERYEGRDCRRLWYNSFIIEDFRPGYVLCSHDHLDHTDPETLPLIYSYSDALFHGPKSAIAHMRRMRFSEDRLVELRPDEPLSLGGCVVTPKRSYHTEDSLGFLIEGGGLRIYFTGDSAYDESLAFLAKAHVDVLIACVNGKYNNMTIADAARLYRDTGASLLVPMHYGLITNNTVPESEIRSIFDREFVRYQILEVEKRYRCVKKPARGGR
jgi:L-ascorbate metabolism protein UlaG (beta-lactamase superfamily)